ncbi:glycosyltransferase family 39 protein [bacterium]|nr:glycosyltransferase family 39 protein [bacterium]
MNISQNINSKTFFILGIACLSILLKLPFIDAPISDWHSWNQVSTVSNARYIYNEGIDAFWHPKEDLFESVNSQTNSVFAEFPILAGAIAIGYSIVGEEAEWIARLICILFSLIGTIYFYLLVTDETNDHIGRIATTMYILSPMVWYFHRTIMTDVPMVSFVIAGLYHFNGWIKNNSYKHLILATLFTALAALFKAYALYVGIIYLLLIIDLKGVKSLFKPAHLFLAIGSLLPIGLWMFFCLSQIQQGSTGVNLTVNSELLGSLDIWFKQAYWARLLSSIGDFTLMPIGLPGFIAALILFKRIKQHRMILYWLGAVLFYFLFVRQGNREHDYYQMPFTAPIVFFSSIGWYYWGKSWISKLSTKQIKWVIAGITCLMVLNGGKYSYTKARQDPSPVVLGKKLDSINRLRERVLIIDPDTLQRNQALYYANVHGWQIRHLPSIAEIDQYMTNGVRWIGVSYPEQSFIKQSSYFDSLENEYKYVWTEVSHDRYDRKKVLRIYYLGKNP